MTQDEICCMSIGTRIIVSGVLYRSRTGKRHEWKLDEKNWPTPQSTGPEPRYAWYVGRTILFNGKPHFEYFSEYPSCMGVSDAESMFAVRVRFSERGREYLTIPGMVDAFGGAHFGRLPRETD